jgi:hypothetical protein
MIKDDRQAFAGQLPCDKRRCSHAYMSVAQEPKVCRLFAGGGSQLRTRL